MTSQERALAPRTLEPRPSALLESNDYASMPYFSFRQEPQRSRRTGQSADEHACYTALYAVSPPARPTLA